MKIALVAAVLAGTIIVALGARLVVQRHSRPPNGENGVFLVLLGALVVVFTTPPMMEQLFPVRERSSLASAPTRPEEARPTPTSADTGSPAPTTPASPGSAPSPPAPQALAPVPSPTTAGTPAPPAPGPRRRTGTGSGGTGATTTPAPPTGTGTAPPAAQPSPPPPASPPPSGPPASPVAPVGPPTSAPPSISPSPTPPSAPARAPTVHVTCTGLGDTMERGDEFTITYEIHATTATKVALGAALLDPEGDDHSDGSGDDDSVEVAAGRTVVTRTVSLPSSLRERTFEVVGRMWPERSVGDRDAEVIDEGSCGSFTVAD